MSERELEQKRVGGKSFRVRISKGVRQNIRQTLKPEARQADYEQIAWVASEKILRAKVESYPEKFSLPQLEAVRRFHRLRWQLRENHVGGGDMRGKITEFMDNHPDRACDPVFAVIAQIFSKPKY